MAKTAPVPCDVLIFDGSNAAHRLSNALQPLTNRKGVRVEVAFGLLRLISAVAKLNPAKACYVVWDGRGSKVLRQKKDPAYKAHRTQMSDEDKHRIEDMHVQVQLFLSEFLAHMPMVSLISEKYEADDIMSMLSHEHTERKLRSTIVTGDKDLLQLVDPYVSVWNPNKNALITVHNFEEFTGYPDGHAFLYGKCLQGDSSDNVPGIPGIGEKTALKLLKEHLWDLSALLVESSFKPGVVRAAIRDEVLSASGSARIALNYRLMALTLKCHRKGLADNMVHVEAQTGVPSWNSLRKSLAVNQMASILTDFNRWSEPFRRFQVEA